MTLIKSFDNGNWERVCLLEVIISVIHLITAENVLLNLSLTNWRRQC